MPILRTPRLTMRPLRPADLDAVHAFAADPEVTRFSEWGPNTREQTAAFLAAAMAPSDTTFCFAVTATPDTDAAVIGTTEIVIDSAAHRRGSFGCTMARPVWGRGFATEAAIGLLEFGFGELGLHKISATCDPENVASARVLEKAGLRREGVLQDHLLVRGEWRDRLLFARLSRSQSVK